VFRGALDRSRRRSAPPRVRARRRLPLGRRDRRDALRDDARRGAARVSRCGGGDQVRAGHGAQPEQRAAARAAATGGARRGRAAATRAAGALACSGACTRSSARPGPQSSAPEAAPPAAKPESAPEVSAAPVVAPPAERAPLAADDPRQQEIAQLEAAIERDREELRHMISTPRWDASELASDPHIREIAERLPRLQAELAALRSEAER
jgi:hypothetical protein